MSKKTNASKLGQKFVAKWQLSTVSNCRFIIDHLAYPSKLIAADAGLDRV